MLEDAPELARRYPRLAHIEFIFDRTCELVAERRGVEPCEAACDVGLWMAAEVQAEINLRHVADKADAPAAGSAAVLDQELFPARVKRLRELRPWLSGDGGAGAVEGFIGTRRAEPLYVPPEWEAEVELQQDRVAQPA